MSKNAKWAHVWPASSLLLSVKPVNAFGDRTARLALAMITDQQRASKPSETKE